MAAPRGRGRHVRLHDSGHVCKNPVAPERRPESMRADPAGVMSRVLKKSDLPSFTGSAAGTLSGGEA
eukprot:6994939-Prymnesium_polylepis.1